MCSGVLICILDPVRMLFYTSLAFHDNSERPWQSDQQAEPETEANFIDIHCVTLWMMYPPPPTSPLPKKPQIGGGQGNCLFQCILIKLKKTNNIGKLFENE